MVDDAGKPVGTIPALLVDIINRFRKFRGPNGETFINTFLWELLMGQFATAYQQHLATVKQKDDTLVQLQTAVDELQRTNSDLLSQVGQKNTTPQGRTLDADDLVAVDAFINDNNPTPTPTPAPEVPVPVPGDPNG